MRASVSIQYKSLRFSHAFLPHRITSRANFQRTGSVARVLLRLEIDLFNLPRWIMRSYINSIVLSCSVLAASVSVAAAPDAQPPQSALVVGAGYDLRCRLEKGLRITKPGEPITAKMVEPVYAGTTIAIPEGSTVKGHVSSISSAPRRKGRLLRGDLTRPR